MLRLHLQIVPGLTRHSLKHVRKLRILLSLFAIPAMTFLYVDDVLSYVPFSFMIPPLPVSIYIACLAWLVFDVLREYNGLVKAERRAGKEDTIDSARD